MGAGSGASDAAASTTGCGGSRHAKILVIPSRYAAREADVGRCRTMWAQCRGEAMRVPRLVRAFAALGLVCVVPFLADASDHNEPAADAVWPADKALHQEWDISD